MVVLNIDANKSADLRFKPLSTSPLFNALGYWRKVKIPVVGENIDYKYSFIAILK